VGRTDEQQELCRSESGCTRKKKMHRGEWEEQHCVGCLSLYISKNTRWALSDHKERFA
jgi:hypothetical protein